MARLTVNMLDEVWFDDASVGGLRSAIGHARMHRTAVEFGSWTGTSTLILSDFFRHVFAVDPWRALPDGPPEYQQADEAYTRFRENTAERYNIVRFRTTDEKFMLAGLDGPLDFVFIDAVHTYDAVLQGIWWAMDNVEMGGVIAGHDYGHDAFPGVKDAVDEAFGEQAQTESLVWWASV